MSWYLKYAGYVDDLILFDVNTNPTNDDHYYAFYYINKNILLITGNGTGHDIRVNKLEKFDEVAINKVTEQVSLF